jgi:uncharacterized repeat protein (TIGR03833 family)
MKHWITSGAVHLSNRILYKPSLEMRDMEPHQQRSQIKPGLKVNIVMKQHQKTGILTQGIVKDILTNSPTHPHGIKVKLTDGKVGRVQSIIK